MDLLVDARVRGVRLPDAWRWGDAFVLDALCVVGTTRGLPDTWGWVTDLETVAAEGQMQELLVRGLLHRAALGQRDAGEAARVLAEEIDNPALKQRLKR